MKNKLLLGSIIFLLGIIIIISNYNPTPNLRVDAKELTQIKINENNKIIDYGVINRTLIEYENIYNKIIKISKNVSESYIYELHVFDCTDFSKELVDRLKKEGIKSQCTAGNNWAFSYTNHTWVSAWINNDRIEIEATSGEIINNENYESYEVKWEDYCW
jgi:hypothetical protein